MKNGQFAVHMRFRPEHVTIEIYVEHISGRKRIWYVPQEYIKHETGMFLSQIAEQFVKELYDEKR